NAMFGRSKNGGGRIGNSVPEARAVLRSAAQIRQAIEERWQRFCEATSPDERLRAVTAVERDGILPSAELSPALGRLRDELDDEIVRLTQKTGVRRPGTVANLKHAEGD